MPSVVRQSDWAGGIFRAPGGPDGTVYDAINALVTDDRDLLKRGGLTVKAGSDLSAAIASLWDGYVLPGQRTVMIDRSSPAKLAVLDADDSTVVQPGVEAGAVATSARGTAIFGVVFWPQPATLNFLAYAGSRKATYTAGTVAVTNASKTVTGTSTAFLANVDAGMFLITGLGFGVVETVDSNTQLTLKDPWAPPSASGTYSLVAGKVTAILGLRTGAADGPVVLTAVNQRLVYGQNRRLRFSPLGMPFDANSTDFWDLPAGARIVGLDAIHDTCVVFTTSGVWTVSNMDFDLTDDAGNVQQQLSLISKDVILWGEAGIAAWAGALIVPALDDVFLLGAGGPQGVISEGIRGLYRSYVKAGHHPGIAAVHRGHYFLPILDASNNVIDTLVCRLDLRDSRGNTRPAWTRWSVGALAAAWAVRTGTGAPKLLAAFGVRLREATDAFTPAAANKQDPGSTTFNLDVTTRDFDTGPGNRNTIQAVRLRYELVDAASDDPTIAASYSTGPEGAAFTSLSGSAPESDGTDPKRWAFVKWTRRIRLRFLSSGPSANLKVRVLEIFVRPSSRS